MWLFVVGVKCELPGFFCVQCPLSHVSYRSSQINCQAFEDWKCILFASRGTNAVSWGGMAVTKTAHRLAGEDRRYNQLGVHNLYTSTMYSSDQQNVYFHLKFPPQISQLHSNFPTAQCTHDFKYCQCQIVFYFISDALRVGPINFQQCCLSAHSAVGQLKVLEVGWDTFHKLTKLWTKIKLTLFTDNACCCV